MFMVKRILVPDDIELEIPAEVVGGTATQRMISFSEFVTGTLLSDLFWGRSSDDLECAGRLRTAIRPGKAGTTILFSITDYEQLAKVTRNPTRAYRPDLCVQLLPFIRAILNVEDYDQDKHDRAQDR